jgi:hypothetical protein
MMSVNGLDFGRLNQHFERSSHIKSHSKVASIRFERKFNPTLSRVAQNQPLLDELKNTYAESYDCKIPLNMLEILQLIQQQCPQLKRSKANLLNVLLPLKLFLLPFGNAVELPIFFRKMVSENALYSLLKVRTLGPEKKDNGCFYNAFEQVKQFLQEKGLIQIHWNGIEFVPHQWIFDDSQQWYRRNAISLTTKSDTLLESV